MNCSKCPHLIAIKKALAPCQVCECGKLHGEVSTDAAPSADLVYAYRRANDHTPSAGVTKLDPDVEDNLRIILATIKQLDPIELLLYQHLAKDGKYYTFNEVLSKVNRTLRTKERNITEGNGAFRSWVNTIAERVRAKLPIMECIFYREDNAR